MDELVMWLRAQIDEDAALARDIVESEAGAPEWEETSSGVLVTGPPTHDDAWEGTHPIGDSRLTRFMAHNDPARVLREVEAKRRRLERHEPRVYDDGTAVCSHCLETGDMEWPCDELRWDLAVYADRPGYQDEWRP